jgi:hypothetical protein
MTISQLFFLGELQLGGGGGVIRKEAFIIGRRLFLHRQFYD